MENNVKNQYVNIIQLANKSDCSFDFINPFWMCDFICNNLSKSRLFFTRTGFYHSLERPDHQIEQFLIF